MISRTIQSKIEESLFKQKIIILYGARQVGKTTLAKQMLSKFDQSKTLYLNADDPDVRSRLSNKTSTELHDFLGDKEIIVIDEAQRVENIGISLKLWIDNFPNQQIIATGSSSFELANKINEPLTGRNISFHLYPFSAEEIITDTSRLEFERLIDSYLIYGNYPGMYGLAEPEKEQYIRSITRDYLFKDIFSLSDIRSPELLSSLLEAIALQLGNEVSYNELASLIGANKETVIRYISLLEQSFIIYKLRPLSRNLRKEIAKKRKIYFYDLGIRNALIQNFNVLKLRSDIGALWENYCITERMKRNANNGVMVNRYYWRTYDQKEIDYLEDSNGAIYAYEFKFSHQKIKTHKDFIDLYHPENYELVSKENITTFITK